MFFWGDFCKKVALIWRKTEWKKKVEAEVKEDKRLKDEEARNAAASTRTSVISLLQVDAHPAADRAVLKCYFFHFKIMFHV